MLSQAGNVGPNPPCSQHVLLGDTMHAARRIIIHFLTLTVTLQIISAKEAIKFFLGYPEGLRSSELAACSSAGVVADPGSDW
jgi:hypothetical protein